MEKTFEEERLEELKLSLLLKYFKLLYIKKLTFDRNKDAYKLLGGDLLTKELTKANEEKKIDLETTNIEAIAHIEDKLTDIIENHVSISKIYDREFFDLGWFKELVSEGLNPNKSLSETIEDFNTLDVPYSEDDDIKYPFTETEYWNMQNRVKKIYKLTLKEENN